MIDTAIILAGGKGTRLQSEISDVPKPMAPVNGRPFLSLILDHLLEQGIEIAILAVGHLSEKVVEHYGDRYKSMKIKYSFETKPLGTGGAIKHAFNQCHKEEALVVNGDTFVQFSLKPLVEFYKFNQAQPVMLLKKLKEFDRYGAVSLSDNFSVDAFHEKQFCEEGYINAGVYIINKTIFNHLSQERFSFENEILEKQLPKYKWFAYPQDVYFKDIGIPEDYHQFIQDDMEAKPVSSADIDKSWTLFLDRDGVINKRKVGGYIETVEEFEFLPSSLEAIVNFSNRFNRIIVVTNQQGIGKALFTKEDLDSVHNHMLSNIKKAGGRIDSVYFCPNLKKDDSICRKPNTGMGITAKMDYPDIEFSKSIMVGDSPSDMEFGASLGMKCVHIISGVEKYSSTLRFKSLKEMSNSLDLSTFKINS